MILTNKPSNLQIEKAQSNHKIRAANNANLYAQRANSIEQVLTSKHWQVSCCKKVHDNFIYLWF